ncbi:SIR2 family NAD-dependent protein deacylase [Psychromonas sp. L1A2]|uniref:SIR2 family NAD-dependent protein deacylase n=1 Tax=Psychromonas sp. L1A2 TaxID=2686356 RepID=UPI00135C49B6|nr:SIR2 family protein [Psychromonas sp. L1A2]
MSEYFEIAYAAVSNRLCLFTGTGFSKAVSLNEAPSWQGLLEEICLLTPRGKDLKLALFPENGKNPLSLEEVAQVLSIELLSNHKNLHDEVSKIISKVEIKGNNSAISQFLSTKSVRVVTTNYDKLAEKLAGSERCQSITPGLPIPRSSTQVKVYHVHGSIESPENMVVTSDDYFKFMNTNSYFSKKLSTVLHENTVVILGYSLGDANLKSIINDYKGFSRDHVIGANIFLVSRNAVDQSVKDYYAHCYGIRVMDSLEVNDFFVNLNMYLPEAEKCTESSIENIRKVVFQSAYFTPSFLKMENAFYEIISSIGAIGKSIEHPEVVRALGQIIESKRKLTSENNAWEQYEHLARWLIYLSSILEIKGTSIEKVYLDATLRSMTSMCREHRVGYSWHAYNSWNIRWSSIISKNRVMIKEFIKEKTYNIDALAVVNQI